MNESYIDEQHQQLVHYLVKDGNTILNTLTPGKVDLLHAIVGLAGEVGELVDAVKKHVMYEKDLDLANIIEELGDMEFYAEQLRAQLNITREETLSCNIVKLRLRYPDGYTNKAAEARADKAPTPLEGPI